MDTARDGRTRPPLGSGCAVRRRWLLVILALVASATVAGACAGGDRLGSGYGNRISGDNDRITAQELGGLTVNNAYDAVTQLRPLWLRSRGRRSYRLPTEIVVAQNGSYFGPLSSLRQFQISDVKELRYLDGPQAAAFLSGLGSRHVEGAIVVELR